MEGMIENLEEAWAIDFSDLEFEALIGKGAFGEVHKGTYFGTAVAIKRIFESDEDSLLYMEREINVLKGMRHPNIVQFIGLSKDEARGFHIVTEFVSGGDLRKKLKDTSIPMSWRLKADVAHQITCAVAYLHSRSIIHRDLKSKNLLVDTNWKIKVCDFGFARTAQKAARPMTICGTGEWMAPEIILGQAYSQKADVFSFGIVLCEIISRKKITTALQRSALDAFGLDVDKFLNLVPDDCPMELQSIALECCVYEAEQRPTFKQLITRLSAIIRSLPRDDPRAKTTAAPPAATPQAKPAPAKTPITATPPAAVNTPKPFGGATSGGGRPAVGGGPSIPKTNSNPSWNRKGGAADLIAHSAPKMPPNNGNRSPTASKVNFPPPGASGFNKVNSPSNSKVTSTSPNNSKFGSLNGGSSNRGKPPPRPMTLYGAEAKNGAKAAPTAAPGFYSYDTLKGNPPKDIDKGNLPQYLDPAEFPAVFGLSKEEYFKLPRWKQIAKKSEVGLF